LGGHPEVSEAGMRARGEGEMKGKKKRTSKIKLFSSKIIYKPNLGLCNSRFGLCNSNLGLYNSKFGL